VVAKPIQEVPEGFKKLIRKQMDAKRLSIRRVAFGAGLDPATLSRILGGLQGLPTDETITRLAGVLGIDPPTTLLHEAHRVDERMMPLLRVTSDLNASELEELLKVAKQIARERRSKKRKGK